MGKARAHVLISGMVQGVFFRSNTSYHAQELRVNGWVRNRGDGKVEAVFEGEKEPVEEMIKWCQKGPPEAVVRDVEIERQDYTGEFDSFSVKYSW